jgi:hypothetical protein
VNPGDVNRCLRRSRCGGRLGSMVRFQGLQRETAEMPHRAAENERGKTMRKIKCALRHVDWLTALCLGALLLTLWCPPGRTEHLGADFAWMAGIKGRGNEACCAVLDCVEATVALLEHNEMESTVMIGETVLTLPSSWVHPSRGPTGMWCFVPQPTTGGKPGAYLDIQGRTRAIPPQTPTRENTRCAFFVSIN